MTNADIGTLREMIQESKYLVAISGSGMQRECGHLSLRDQERAYDIEAEYGYSPEEMFTSAFYNTRMEPFYKFYKKEVLQQKFEAGPAYLALAELAKKGILKTVVARGIYGICRSVGCQNVLEPHGNINNNICPHCRKEYTKEYLLEAKKVPLCEDCMTPIRPGILLYGEMIDNAVMTKVAEEISKADVLLVLGARLEKDFFETTLRYYQGDKLILLTNRETHSDEDADYVMYGRLNEMVPALV